MFMSVRVVFSISTLPECRAGSFFVAKRQCFELKLRFPNNEFQFFFITPEDKESCYTSSVHGSCVMFCWAGLFYLSIFC